MKGKLQNLIKAKNRVQQPQQCVICIFIVEDEPVKDAITTLAGYAVCFDHLGVVRTNDFMQLVGSGRIKLRPASDWTD